MTDPEELERKALSNSQEPDPWSKEQQTQDRFDNLMEDTMSLILAAAISGILIAALLN